MVKRNREEEEGEASPWEKLEAANETMATLADGTLANEEEKAVISVGWKALKTMLNDSLGPRERDREEYSPTPQGKTRHRRELSESQVQDLKRLVGLEHLWEHKLKGRDLGKVMLMYDLTGQGLPSNREALILWLNEETHETLYMPKIEAANVTIASLDDPAGLQVDGPDLTTISDGFRAIRDLLREAFEYNEKNYSGKLTVRKESLTEKQLAILSSLAAMDYIWLYQGYPNHLLKYALRDIGLPLKFPVRMDQDYTSIQRSLRRFLDA